MIETDDWDWLAEAQHAESSYAENDLGEFLYGLVRSTKPAVCVELGVLNGYSTLYIAAALRDNGKDAKLYAYDRWPGHIQNCERNTRDRIKRAGLDDWVYLETRDVFASPPFRDAKDRFIDFLHVDLENTYSTLSWTFDNYADRVSKAGVMVFEGGTLERDRLEWVHRHDPRGGVRRFLTELPSQYYVYVLPAFPGITVVGFKYE